MQSALGLPIPVNGRGSIRTKGLDKLDEEGVVDSATTARRASASITPVFSEEVKARRSSACSNRLENVRASLRLAPEFVEQPQHSIAQLKSGRTQFLLDASQTKRQGFCQKCWSKCTGAIAERRRKAAPYCRSVNKNKFFQMAMFAALLSALFLPDIWILADMADNKDLDVVLTVVPAMFLFELTIQSVGYARTYWGSFFFWMDLLGAGSLLLDLSYLGLLDAFGSSGAVSNNVVIMRAARIAKLGARAGRFTRLVKLLRFLPGMREQGADQGTAKVISARLITALSTRVSCLIIVMVMVMPLFSMWTYPEQDWSMKSWLDVLNKTSYRHPSRFADQLEQFGKFFDNMDYYPVEVRAKSGAYLQPPVLAALPWYSPRGGSEAPNELDRAD
jgi:hypothetical protein